MNKVVHSTILTVIIAVIAYAAVAMLSGGDEVWHAINSLSLSVWLIILALSLLNYLLRYVRWYCYVSYNNPLQIGHLHHLAIYIAGFALTTTPGKAGEAMRSLYLKPYGIEHRRSIAAFFVERIMDLLNILMLAAFGLSFLQGKESIIATIATIAIIGGCIVLIKIPKKTIIQSRLVQKLPKKVYETIVFIESMLESASDFLSFRFLVLGISLGFIAWLGEAYGLYLVMQDYQLDQTTASLGIAIYGMAILIGALSFLPGGLGGAEVMMIFLLMKAGFDEANAVAITFICRLATLWFAVVLGVISLFILTLMGLKPKEELDDGMQNDA